MMDAFMEMSHRHQVEVDELRKQVAKLEEALKVAQALNDYAAKLQTDRITELGIERREVRRLVGLPEGTNDEWSTLELVRARLKQEISDE